MDIIDIREKQLFSNQEIFLIYKNVLRNNEYDSFKKFDVFIFLIRYISDEQLLTDTLELLKEITFFKSSFIRLSEVDLYLDNQKIIQEKDKTKLKASICHTTLLCNLHVQTFKTLVKSSDIPELKFKINDTHLEYNLTEITDFIKKASFGSIRNNILNLPSKGEQETEIKKLCQSLDVVDYDYNTKTFKRELKHFNNLKQNLFVNSANIKVKHDNIFSNNGFILFEYLLNNHIRKVGKTGRYADISDYFWKMYDSQTQYIHQRPEVFKTWFLKEYNEDIGKIKRPLVLKNIDRDKHYSNALEWFNNQN